MPSKYGGLIRDLCHGPSSELCAAGLKFANSPKLSSLGSPFITEAPSQAFTFVAPPVIAIREQEAKH